ncbi:hypothetical protein CkaCkLH20_08972 [Colletotrichum karsti]|uniref:Heterokaryon incompatibility domain-containing protein n=1 Tax=Colletotrichum karsti TaxID=1095194 RepID=A0A9P6HZ28_9PEZI|nr:uncharacterized protein CkaCkLH20_08972 [Colletotrichum karsti]KAF9873513.1 hypothetical protein CkaCkLH20_08972 [Colletotrichum karsti]
MWLLNTKTLKLEEHVDPAAIKYAILSHTWEEDEVSFRDISDLDLAKRKAGFTKIAKTCRLARSRGIRLAWVDTCCIDKSSSAELSEAINSMFQWYKLSAVCFAYLSDFVIRSPDRSSRVRESFFEIADEDAFKRCKWFTRGWTLQELIAPKIVEFYDSSWGLVGTKSQLPEILESITRIPLQVLLNSSKLQSTIVAVKMSWAAQRQTKRIEDRAYSLLGIFDINMPLIYGEGAKAFRRLQEEIVKETNDLSLHGIGSPYLTTPVNNVTSI